jgi:ubiquitin fusion degradation protein 1
MDSFFGGMRGMTRQPMYFETHFQCYSTAMAGRANLEDGDKILLPPSALDTLARMNVDFPMLFELTNETMGKKTHCGVLEFSAEEGRCYIPFWMMQNLLMEEGGLLKVKNVSLSKATFVKLRAQSCDFLDISNPRAVLEVTLRKFTCLSVGDCICIRHSDRTYYIDVREVKPNGAASIIETDCSVDFEEPLGYAESEQGKREKKWKEDAIEKEELKKNGGVPSSINGGSASTTAGGLVRHVQKARNDNGNDKKSEFEAFAGSSKRIDGKDGRSPSGKAIVSSSSSSSSTVAANLTSSSTSETKDIITPSGQQKFGTKISDKYGKKKVAVSAFTGTANKLK